jgi:hypothetical protein
MCAPMIVHLSVQAAARSIKSHQRWCRSSPSSGISIGVCDSYQRGPRGPAYSGVLVVKKVSCNYCRRCSLLPKDPRVPLWDSKEQIRMRGILLGLQAPLEPSEGVLAHVPFESVAGRLIPHVDARVVCGKSTEDNLRASRELG